MAKKKGVRSMNPADAHRKEQRKKEIKKNKADRMRVRKVAMAVKDTTKLETELEQLTGREKQGCLDKNAKLKKQALEEKLNKIVETKKSMGVKYEPKTAGAGTDSSEFRDPTRSVYYHPLLNPHGTAPPGKQYREIEEGEAPAYPPPQKDTTDDESDKDDESNSDESEDSNDDPSEAALEPSTDEKQEKPAAIPQFAVSLSQPQHSLGPNEPPPLPTAPRPEQRWNLFSCLPEQPAVIFPRKTHVAPHPFPRPPMGFPLQHPSYSGPPPYPGHQLYPPPQMPPIGFPPMPPNAAYPPLPYMGIRPQGPQNYAPPGQLPHQTHPFPPVYHHPPHAQQFNGFPGSYVPGPPGIAHPNQRPPTASHTMSYSTSAPHPRPIAPPSTTINISSTPQAVIEPDASTIISASPQIRDFQKEITALVPTHLKRKRPVSTKTPAASRSTGTVRPSINAAPDLGDDDAENITSTFTGPGSSTTNSLVASIFGTNGPIAKSIEVSSTKIKATPALSPLAVDKPKMPTTADEYARFMQEMGGLIEEK